MENHFLQHLGQGGRYGNGPVIARVQGTTQALLKRQRPCNQAGGRILNCPRRGPSIPKASRRRGFAISLSFPRGPRCGNPAATNHAGAFSLSSCPHTFENALLKWSPHMERCPPT
ncbi:hypothetical protein GWK47_003219 [Chionoecetes opilio]|uniref:Uncharacterized protein n=1 Tax=Chionoecetes opilio TaxID=41210 RepID=A0A8J8WL96_CHIOP|nr:hypothetical protein GWK47_003219 [Chionoecetes opilio]